MPSRTTGIRRGLPALPGRVIPRLTVQALLDREAPLTVVAAPAGHGKTTALVQWVEHRLGPDTAVLWVDLTHLRTPEEVITRLAELAVGRLVDAGDAAHLLDRFLVSAPAPWLVLDHVRVGDGELGRSVTALLARHRHLKVVACCRALPDLSGLAHTVSHRVIDRTHLVFSEAEMERLATAHGVPVGADTLRRVRELTEGWPQWAHRAVAALRTEPGPGWEDDLALEWWNEFEATGTDAEVAWLRTVGNLSVLEEDTAVRLTGEPARAHFGELSEQGVLLSDGAMFGSARRVHTLALEALRRLPLGRIGDSTTLPDPERAELARGLVEEALARGDHLTAFRETLVLSDDEALRELTAAHWLELLRDQPLNEEVHARLRRAGLATHPDITAAIAWYELWTEEGAVNRAEEVPRSPSRLRAEPADDELMTQLFEVIGHRAAGRVAHSDRAGRVLVAMAARVQARDLAAGTPSLVPLVVMHALVTRQLTADWVSCLPILLSLHRSGLDDASGFTDRNVEGALSHLLALSGDLNGARRWAEREAAHAPQGWWIERRLATQGNLGRLWVAMEDLDPHAAEEVLGTLRRQRHDDELWPHIVEGVFTYELHWGDPETAAAELRDLGRRYHLRLRPDDYAALVLARIAVDLKLALGHGAGVPALLAHLPPDHPWGITRRARLDLAIGRPEQALTHRLVPGGRTARDRMELDCTQAAALVRLGRLEEARDRAQRVAAVARRSGMRLPLAQLPASDRDVLAGLSPDLAEVLARVGARLPVLAPEPAEVVELSDREHAVLHCLAAGLTREEVAGELFVSINTVKTQLRSLYRKLGVAGRSEALTRARVVGLL